MQEGRARAGFALSAVLFVLALPGLPTRQQACEHPQEAAGRDGVTTQVLCGTTGNPGTEISGPARRLFGLPIDLNCAQASTFETFQGIGPARAKSIVDARTIRPFERVEDLVRVHGIGPKTLERMRDGLVVLPATARSAIPGSLDSPGCRLADRRAQRDREEGRL